MIYYFIGLSLGLAVFLTAYFMDLKPRYVNFQHPPTALLSPLKNSPMTLTGTYPEILQFMALTTQWHGPIFFWQHMNVTKINPENNLLKIQLSVIFLSLP